MPEPEELVKKISLDEEQLKRLKIWLTEEIKDAEEARGAQEKKWLEWIKIYEAKPEKERKTFPWLNASNVVVAVAGEHVDTIFARIMGVQHGVQPLWMVKPSPTKNGIGYEEAKDIQRALDYKQKYHFDMYNVDSDAIMECLQLGTAWYKIPWVHDAGKTWTYKKSIFSKKWKPVKEEIIFYEGPKPQFITNWDILVPIDAVDEQSCRWLSHIYRFGKSDIIKKKNRDIWGSDVVNILVDHLERTPSEGEEIKEQHRNREGTWPLRAQLHEIWAYYDIDDDGIDERCVFDYHLPTNTLVDARFWFYGHGRRPFARIFYKKQPNSIYGIGVPEMLVSYQNEITTIHNQRIDNMTIANARCTVSRPGVVKSGTKVYPGKNFTADDPSKDIQAFQLGEIYPSSENAERIAQTYAERRSGVSEYTMGRESETVRTRATATGTLALIQEGNKRHDLHTKNIRKGEAEVGMQVVELYQQFKPDEGIPYYIEIEEEKKGKKSKRREKRIADVPKEYLRDRMQIEVIASSTAFNQDVERENSFALYQLMDAFNNRMMQMAQVVINPQIPKELKEMTREMMVKTRELMERIVEGINIKDADQYIPQMKGVIGGGGKEPVEPELEGNIPSGPGGPGEVASMGEVPTGIGPEMAGMFGAGAPGGGLPGS